MSTYPRTIEYQPIDNDFVIAAMERDSRTLAAMTPSGHNTRLRTSRLMAFDPDDPIYLHNRQENRPAAPSPGDVDEMDAVFLWLGFIPDNRKVLRKIVGARSVTSRHDGKAASWYSIGKKLGLHPQAAQRWHAQAIALIVAELVSLENED